MERYLRDYDQGCERSTSTDGPSNKSPAHDKAVKLSHKEEAAHLRRMLYFLL